MAGRISIRPIRITPIRFPMPPRPRGFLTPAEIEAREVARITARQQFDPLAQARTAALQAVTLGGRIKDIRQRFADVFENADVRSEGDARALVGVIAGIANEFANEPAEVQRVTGLDRVRATLSTPEGVSTLIRRVMSLYGVPMTEIVERPVAVPLDERGENIVARAGIPPLPPVSSVNEVAQRIRNNDPQFVEYHRRLIEAAGQGDPEAIDALAELDAALDALDEKGGSEGEEGIETQNINPPVSPRPTAPGERGRISREGGQISEEGFPSDILTVFGERVPTPSPSPGIGRASTLPIPRERPPLEGEISPTAPPPSAEPDTGPRPTPRRVPEGGPLEVRRRIRVETEREERERPLSTEPIEVPTTAEIELFRARSGQAIQEAKTNRQLLNSNINNIFPAVNSFREALEAGNVSAATAALSSILETAQFLGETRGLSNEMSAVSRAMLRVYADNIGGRSPQEVASSYETRLLKAGRNGQLAGVGLVEGMRREAEGILSEIDRVNRLSQRELGRPLIDRDAVAGSLEESIRTASQMSQDEFERRLKEKGLLAQATAAGRRAGAPPLGRRIQGLEGLSEDEVSEFLNLTQDDFASVTAGEGDPELVALWNSLSREEKRAIVRMRRKLRAAQLQQEAMARTEGIREEARRRAVAIVKGRETPTNEERPLFVRAVENIQGRLDKGEPLDNIQAVLVDAVRTATDPISIAVANYALFILLSARGDQGELRRLLEQQRRRLTLPNFTPEKTPEEMRFP